MLISHRFNFIYTKTAKTAGTSVEVFFEPYCLPEGEWSFSHARDERVTDAGVVGYRGGEAQGKTWRNHMPAREIRDKIGRETWDSYYKFCVIRNPFDKAVSMYNWMRQRDSSLKTKIKNFATSQSVRLLQLDFQRWARTIWTDRDKYTIEGDFCMDDLIFFERLQKDTERISARLNLPIQNVELPRLKTGIRKKQYATADYYNPTSRQIVGEAFRPEIEAFGYALPGDDGSADPALNKAQNIDWPETGHNEMTS